MVDTSRVDSWRYMLEVMQRAGFAAETLRKEFGASQYTWERWIRGEKPPREMTRRLLLGGMREMLVLRAKEAGRGFEYTLVPFMMVAGTDPNVDVIADLAYVCGHGCGIDYGKDCRIPHFEKRL